MTLNRKEGAPQHESALSGVRIERLPVTSEDYRRRLTEYFDSNNIGLGPNVKIGGVKTLEIKQPSEGEEIVVGGHWEQGAEVIWIHDGKISSLKLADVTTGEEMQYEHISAGSRVILPPMVAHQLRFTGPASLTILNEVPFSPDKLIVYPSWKN